MSEEKKFANPRDEFLFMLNKDLEQIYALIGNMDDTQGQERGVGYMCTFIQRLEIPDSDEWKDMLWLQKHWTPDIGFNTNMFHKDSKEYRLATDNRMLYPEIFGIWRELSRFMNGTYFKGWNGGKPQETRPVGRL